jgi:hypothetical protein
MVGAGKVIVVFGNLIDVSSGSRQKLSIECSPDKLPMLKKTSAQAEQAAENFKKMISCIGQESVRSCFAETDLKKVSLLAKNSAEEFKKMFQ